MSWHAFEWSDLVTDGVIERLVDAAGASLDGSSARVLLEPPLLAYLSSVGGSPVAETDYGTAARTTIALRLLGEGASALLAPVRRRVTPGLVQVSEDPPTYRAAARIAINRAPVSALEGLPRVGPALAHKMVEARRSEGPFRGAEDLAARVDGIGEETAAACAAVASFAPPFPSLPVDVTGDVDLDLATLCGLYPGDQPIDRLVAALEAMAQYAATNPHPDRHETRLARLAAHGPQTSLDAGTATMLIGSRYYHALQVLLAAAGQRIDVCMFHIAFPSATHPTRALLDALTGAVGRGVTVRALLDADRPGDPYRSTVINQPAIDHLKANGVAVKVDDTDRLLHSKFVLIDDDVTVIGSHNWSAGSYFQHDDLTLVLTSASVAAEQTSRFDDLWSAASDA